MVLLSFAFVLPSSWWLSGLEAALFIHIRLLRAHKVVLKNPSTEQLIGVRCKKARSLSEPPIVRCCKLQSHYTGDECRENMGSEKSPPALVLAILCFRTQCTPNHRCSKTITKTVSRASFLFILSSFFISDEVVIAEDHHSETHRTHIQSFFQSNYPNSSWDKPHQRPKLIMHLAVLLGSWSRKINMA